MQGVGGLEAINTYGHSAATGVVQDYFGNVLGTISGGAVSWNPTRFSSYGPVPGYQSPALSLDVGLAQSLGWRGKRVDETGYINLGARLYDPVAGRFISADPLGHAACQDLYSFCGGDPVNRFDPDGRCVEGGAAAAGGLITGTANLVNNTLGATAYALTSSFAPDWSYQNLGGYAQGFANTVMGTAQFGYNVAATATYGAISPFAPDFAYNNYGGSVQQLMGQAPAFYGGNNQPLAYQIGYGAVNVATMLMGGEGAEVGNLGKVGELTDAGAQAARVAEATETGVWDLSPFARG
jgi:RHS repeat-associated protein